MGTIALVLVVRFKYENFKMENMHNGQSVTIVMGTYEGAYVARLWPYRLSCSFKMVLTKLSNNDRYGHFPKININWYYVWSLSYCHIWSFLVTVI